MGFKKWLQEARMMITLGDIARVGLNIHDADFWLQRKGTVENVGRVHRTPNGENFTKENIGVKVHEEWKAHIDPKYLSYMMEFQHMQGLWRGRASGMLRLVSIQVTDVRNLEIMQAEVPDDDVDPTSQVH